MTERDTPDETPADLIPADRTPADPPTPVTAVPDDPPSTDPDRRAGTPAPDDIPGPAPAGPVLAQPDLAEPVVAEPVVAEPVVAEPVPAEPVPAGSVDGGAGDGGAPADGPVAGAHPAPERDADSAPPSAPWRPSSAGALILVLIALFGFTLVVQLRSNDTEQGLSTMRQEDLVRILSDLDARETRLNSEISNLEESQRDLTSGVQGRQAALEEAERRADELGLLAGTLPGRGPGLVVELRPGGEPIKASAVLNTVQELRGAGGEAMQIAGGNGAAVRVVASSAFVDDGGQVAVDGVRLPAPFVITVIGAPQTMETALNIPGGVVASVGNAGGTVIAEQRKAVDVTAVRSPGNLQYARPVP